MDTMISAQIPSNIIQLNCI